MKKFIFVSTLSFLFFCNHSLAQQTKQVLTLASGSETQINILYPDEEYIVKELVNQIKPSTLKHNPDQSFKISYKENVVYVSWITIGQYRGMYELVFESHEKALHFYTCQEIKKIVETNFLSN